MVVVVVVVVVVVAAAAVVVVTVAAAATGVGDAALLIDAGGRSRGVYGLYYNHSYS